MSDEELREIATKHTLDWSAECGGFEPAAAKRFILGALYELQAAHEKECSQLAEVIADTQQLNIAMRAERDQLRARLDEAERLLLIWHNRYGNGHAIGANNPGRGGMIADSTSAFLAPPPSAPVHGETGRHAFGHAFECRSTHPIEQCAEWGHLCSCGKPPGGEHT